MGVQYQCGTFDTGNYWYAPVRARKRHADLAIHNLSQLEKFRPQIRAWSRAETPATASLKLELRRANGVHEGSSGYWRRREGSLTAAVQI